MSRNGNIFSEALRFIGLLETDVFKGPHEKMHRRQLRSKAFWVHLLPGTQYLLPGTKYLLPGTKYLLPGTKYFCCQARVTLYSTCTGTSYILKTAIFTTRWKNKQIWQLRQTFFLSVEAFLCVLHMTNSICIFQSLLCVQRK